MLTPLTGKHLSLASQALCPCSQPPSGACRRGSPFYRALRDKSCFLLLQPLMTSRLPRTQVWSGSWLAPVSVGQNQTMTASWLVSSTGESPLGTPLPHCCSAHAFNQLCCASHAHYVPSCSAKPACGSCGFYIFDCQGCKEGYVPPSV